MSCEIIEKEGSLITAKISGLLKREELAQVEKIAVKDMKSGNKVRFLILVESFMGWDNRDGRWIVHLKHRQRRMSSAT